MGDGTPPTCATWFLDERLGAMPMPHPDELAQLRAFGVGTVISLTEEWHDPAVFRRAGLRNVYIPIPDYGAPTMDQVREFVAEADAALARGEKVVVHCLAGLGRTGTMIACYLVARGRTADEAIEEVRRKRRGSIQSLEQEMAIYEWWAEVMDAPPTGTRH
jgi:atypical dual specificity phosphatase